MARRRLGVEGALRAARSAARLVEEHGLAQDDARRLSRQLAAAGRLTSDGRDLGKKLSLEDLPRLSEVEDV